MTTSKLVKIPTLQAGPWLERIVWNEQGLVPGIAQEASSGPSLSGKIPLARCSINSRLSVQIC